MMLSFTRTIEFNIVSIEFNRNPNVITELYLSFTICFKIKSNKTEVTYCATRTPNLYWKT